MKNLILITLVLSIFSLSSCKKKNFCYSCVANGTDSSWQNDNIGQQKSESKCDLTRSDRDHNVRFFEETYTQDRWNVSCTSTSE